MWRRGFISRQLIAAIMELLNDVSGFNTKTNSNAGPVLKEALYNMILMITIFAPHIAEGFMSRLAAKDSLLITPGLNSMTK